MPSGRVVIVSGPPGSGKSTLASALAERAERGVHLESDVFYRWIRAGFLPPHLPGSHEQNTAVMDVAADAAAGYASAGYLVVWDGIVGPWFLDRVTRRLAARDVVVDYVVVRASRDVALARVLDRDRGTDTVGAEKMWDELADVGEYEPHVVAADGPAGEVLAAAEAALASGRLRLEVDPWVDDRWPVSVKGVLAWDGRVVVLRNRRGEWELPGGRLDAADPSPAAALVREIAEELGGLDARVGALVDAWVYPVDGKRVLILTHACQADRPESLGHSDEHTEVGLLTLDELRGAPIPEGYLRSIEAALVL